MTKFNFVVKNPLQNINDTFEIQKVYFQAVYNVIIKELLFKY